MSIAQLRALFDTAQKHWFAVIALTLLGALIGALISLLVPVTYQSTARLFIATPNWNDSTASAQPDNSGRVETYAFGDEFTQSRVMTYQELVKSQRVASAVVDRLRLATTPDELSDRVDARVVPDTVLIEVTARDLSPEGAARIADIAADELGNLIMELETPFRVVTSPVQPVLIEPAPIPVDAASPRVLMNLLAGAVLGFLAGITYAAVRQRYSSADLSDEILFSDSNLGVLRSAGNLPLFTSLDELGHELAEDVRYLTIRLTADLPDVRHGGGQTVLLCAPHASDVVSASAVLLAAGLAEVHKRVAIVLTNFAEPDSTSSEQGLADAIAGRQPIDTLIRFDDTGRIGVITAGATFGSVTAALAGEQMAAIVQRLEAIFDYVLLLGAPVLVCPVPPSTTDEITESERLIRLAGTTVTGRILVVDNPPSARVSGVRLAGAGTSNTAS